LIYIFEFFFNLENGWFRSLYNTILGLALGLLVISGVYLLDNKERAKKENNV
jgi:high-affinity Fe2+/Pb2+ permease